MNCTGDRQRLLEALGMVGSVVPVRPAKPILGNVRFIVAESGGTLLTTDLEVAIRCRVDLLSVGEPGDILLNFSRLLGILRESDGQEVRIATDERGVTISCGSAEYRMVSKDSEEFPEIPEFQEERAFVLAREPFRVLIRKTHFATAKEKGRYAFYGVRFEVEKDEARMIATDGKRMALKRVAIDNPQDVSAAHIIPTKGLLTCEKALTPDDPSVRIVLDEKQMMIRTGRCEVSTRLIEGAFPRYQAVIPKTTALTASFPREALMGALRRAGVLTAEESRAVRFTFEDGKLILHSRAMDVGEARVEIETSFEGTPLQPAFNPDFLVEGLKVMEADTVTVKLSGKDTPALVEGEENYTYVVMPVTLRSG